MNSKQQAFEREVSQSILSHWQQTLGEDRIAHLIKDTSKSLLRGLQDRIAEHGVSIGHWFFLRVLWHKDGLTKRELSIQAGVMEPTTFTALNAMQAAGLIEFHKHDGNKKNIYVFLTPKGKALEQVLIPLAEEVNDVAAQGISLDDLKTTRRVLLQMLENLNE
jgi:DNA-binding MarR family transcriptional regulator